MEYAPMWAKIFNGQLMCKRNPEDKKAKLIYTLEECKIVAVDSE